MVHIQDQLNGVNLCQYVQTMGKNFISIKQVSRENKLRELHFKFLHRIVTKELCRFGIKDDSEYLYCGEHDSIDHPFSDSLFTKGFLSKVVQWLNNCNNSLFKPRIFIEDTENI